MRVNKMEHPNQGIKCEVNTCYYHMSGDKCSAEQIEVKPKNASTSEQTDCTTFISQS